MPHTSAGTYDIAVVGYGPVGATFANLMARYGVTVAVIDQQAGIYDKPRAITIDHEVLRVFQACGLAEFAETHIAPHPGTHYLGIDRQVIKKFDPLPPPYPLGWTPTATFVQPEFEMALREKLSAYAEADVFLSAQAIDIAQNGDAVTLTVKDESGNTRRVTARYLVACDGANSFVRKHLGIAMDDLAFDEWWMVIDALDHHASERPPKCFQYCWPSRPGTFLPGPGALRRWEIKLLPGEDPETFARRDNVMKVLVGFTDVSVLEIWRTAVYRFHARLAQSWQSGRIFLMGDAVHQTPPFLGQGLSAGIGDAVNLAWKLALVLRGDAQPALLGSYEQERKPHVSAVVALAKEFGLIIGELDPDAAAARDIRLREELLSGRAVTIRQKFIPDLTGGLIAADAPAAGTLFPQPFLRTGTGDTRLDDVMPPEFTLVAASADAFAALTPQARAIWSRLKGQFAVITPSARGPDAPGVHVFRETDRLFADWLARHKIVAAVVRPDRAVHGGANSGEALNELVIGLAKQLGLH